MLLFMLSLSYLPSLISEALDKVFKRISLIQAGWNCEYSASKGNERRFLYMGETAGCISTKKPAVLHHILQTRSRHR